jgi:hypothetical protein
MSATGKAAQILDTLLARIAALDLTTLLGAGARVAYPEPSTTFAPPADGKYLAVSYFPNRPAAEGLSSGRVDQGLLQVSVVWPRNQGLIKPAQVVQAVIDHFPNGLALVSGSTRVKVSGNPWAAAPITDTDRVSFPVTIPWTA